MKARRLGIRSTVVLLTHLAVSVAAAESLLIDDFTAGELYLPLPADVTFDEITQYAQLGPVALGPRKWERVWSGIRDEGQSATLAVDTEVGVFRIDTPGDPFTYFDLSYELFGGYEFFQPLPLNANEAGVDRVRLRFRGESARLYHTLTLTSETGETPLSSSRSFGGRFVSVPGGVLEVPFTEFSSDPAFFDALTEFSLTATRFQGDFELDAIELAGPSATGDLNRDGVVDDDDLAYLQAAFLGVRSGDDPDRFASTPYHTADLNRDGQIDAADYTVWRDAFADAAAPGGVVPEPSSGLLVLLLLASCPSRRPSGESGKAGNPGETA